MLKKRLNKDDNIASELLDNIFVQVNSMSEMVSQLEYVSNSNSNRNNNGIYNSADYYKDDIKDNDSLLIATEIASTDMNNEIWVPVKEEIDFDIDDNDSFESDINES